MPDPSTTSEKVVAEVLRRMDCRESVAPLMSPDLRVLGRPPAMMVGDLPKGPDDRIAAIRDAGYRIAARALEAGSRGRVLVDARWVHDADAPGAGSAAAYYVVLTVTSGQVEEIRYFEDAEAARGYADLAAV